jgi:5-methylcytosine-specific restriction endonuclease McrA
MRLEMDHIDPYAKGGQTSYTNGDPKCHTCHQKKTAQDRLFWNDSG